MANQTIFTNITKFGMLPSIQARHFFVAVNTAVNICHKIAITTSNGSGFFQCL